MTEQDGKRYTLSLLLFSLVSCAFTYAILRLQHVLPLNPQGFGPVSPDLAFNTAVSFTTNTNWQGYSGESTLSYLSQMTGLTLQNFVSAAVGIGLSAALVRGIARHSTRLLGNFWVDLVRITYYLLLPICLVFSVFLVSQGVIQNFRPYTKAKLIEPHQTGIVERSDSEKAFKDADGKPAMKTHTTSEQSIAQGPVASQVAIKMLGTNGGGFMNANAAHPFENPTPLSNFIQMLAIFSIGSGLTYYLGRMVKDQKHGWTVWSAMMLFFLSGATLAWRAESMGNPIHEQLGVASADGNMEGKEVRFGIFDSALFATITTDASCGAVNSMHDSFTPLGGLVPLVNIQLGEVIFGGVGAGLYGMLVFVLLVVFIAGLMVGRTPEYLGKKIQAYEVKISDALAAGLVLLDSGFLRVGGGEPLGTNWIEQRRPAWPKRSVVCFQFGDGQQWKRLRRAYGQYALVRFDPGRGHAHWQVPDDCTHHGIGWVSRAKEDRPSRVWVHSPFPAGRFLFFSSGRFC